MKNNISNCNILPLNRVARRATILNILIGLTNCDVENRNKLKRGSKVVQKRSENLGPSA